MIWNTSNLTTMLQQILQELDQSVLVVSLIWKLVEDDLACPKLPIKVVYDLEVTEYDFHNNDSLDLNLSASDEESTHSKTN